MMSYTPINWKDDPDTSTPLDAENLNHMDSQIKASADGIEALKGKTYQASLNKGQTQITFTVPGMKDETKLNLYCRDKLIAPKDVSVTATTVTFNFNAYDEDLVLLLEVI